VSDGGRQRIHLDLDTRTWGVQLSLRASVAFPAVAKLAVRLLGSSAGSFGRSSIIDREPLDALDPKAPMWVFDSRDDLAALAPELGRYLVEPMVSYLDERSTVAAFTEATRAAWLAAAEPGHTGMSPVVVAAGEFALGRPERALGFLELAYPAGTPGRQEYAEAFTVAREIAPGVEAEVPAAPGKPALRFELSTANSLVGIPVPNPGPEQIERVVRNLNEDRFATLLQRSDGVYAQVGVGPKAGAAAGAYALEHRAGPDGEHLRADTTDPDDAVRFLQAFRAGDDWRANHDWRVLHL
jgi:hypothetical protein